MYSDENIFIFRHCIPMKTFSFPSLSGCDYWFSVRSVECPIVVTVVSHATKNVAKAKLFNRVNYHRYWLSTSFDYRVAGLLRRQGNVVTTSFTQCTENVLAALVEDKKVGCSVDEFQRLSSRLNL